MKYKTIKEDWKEKLDDLLWKHVMYGTTKDGINDLDHVVFNRFEAQYDLIKFISDLLDQQKKEIIKIIEDNKYTTMDNAINLTGEHKKWNDGLDEIIDTLRK